MPDPITTAVALAGGYRLVRGMLRRPPPKVVPDHPPARGGRPDPLDMPLFSPVRGAHLTSAAAVERALLADPGPLYELASIMWPARKYLNKLTFVTGKPGSGKTTAQKMAMASAGQLFHKLVMRWFVTDPTNAYLRYLYQTLPEHVEIIRASPHDAHGWRWNIRKDVTDELTNEALQTALFPDALFKKSGDPFWYTKARELTQAEVNVFHDRDSEWEFRDLIVPLKYPQFLKPLLLQSPRTTGKVKHELVGKLGRDIVTTGSSVLNRMATAAAQWQHATRSFSLKDFINRPNQVIHFAFTPLSMASLTGIANAMSYLLILFTLERDDELNHTVAWFDEGRFLDGITGIELLAARGRGAGFGAFVSCQTIKGMIATWGKDRVDELIELVATWITFTAGYETARAFSQTVGQIEGLEKSYSYSQSTSHSDSSSSGTGSSWNWQSGTTSSSNRSASSSDTRSSSYSESFKLSTKDAILPSEVTNLLLADPDTDTLSGYVFNPDTGAFRFDCGFLDHFESLPPAPFKDMPVRHPSTQVLQPWDQEDLIRLKLDMTPEFAKALRVTWGHLGGVVKTTAIAVLTGFLVSVLAGCGGPPPQPTNKGEKKPPTTKDTFESPAPTEAAHDPRVIALKATTDQITQALTGVRDRLKDIKAALESKTQTEKDLLKVAGELKALTSHARSDLDTIWRLAEDLREHLPLAQKGYLATAEYYRERGTRLKDPALRAIQFRMADEMERLAAVTPARVELTDRFIAELLESRAFLAETDRCLGDTKTALEILTAGPAPVTVSGGGKAFRRHLEVFVAIIEEYQKKLLAPPPVGSAWDQAAPPRPECPPAPPNESLPPVTEPSGPSRTVYQTYRCETCGRFHVGVYRVSPDTPALARLSGSYTPVGHERENALPGGR